MIGSTFFAASLAAVQPQATPPAPAMDHSKMERGKSAAPGAKKACCKDGCACCAKMKDKPAT